MTVKFWHFAWRIKTLNGKIKNIWFQQLVENYESKYKNHKRQTLDRANDL